MPFYRGRRTTYLSRGDSVGDEDAHVTDVASVAALGREHVQPHLPQTACRVRVTAPVFDSVHGVQHVSLVQVIVQIEVKLGVVAETDGCHVRAPLADLHIKNQTQSLAK